MRRIILVLAALALSATACAEDPPTETVGALRELPAADTSSSAAGDELDEGAEPAAATPESEVCAAIESVLVGPEAVAAGGFGDEASNARLLAAVEPLGEDAVAAVDALLGFQSGTMEEMGQRVVAMDAVTLEPCGWPLFGAIGILSETEVEQRFCEVSASLSGDDGPEFIDEECPGAAVMYPDELPCFEPTGVDPELIGPGVRHWFAIDCESGDVVEWDSDRGAWVVEERSAAGDFVEVPGAEEEEPDEDYVFASSGDPCVDLERLIVGRDADAVGELTDSEQEELVRSLMSAVDPDANAVLDRLVALDMTMSSAEVGQLVVAADALTLGPCGWPFFGAMSVVAVTGVRFCEVDAPIGEDAPALPDPADRCEADFPPAPDHLPCFSPSGADPTDFAEMGVPLWNPVDCVTEEVVEWDGDVMQWVPLA